MSFWSYVTGEDDELKTLADNNAAQRQLNWQRYSDGRITLAQYQANLRLLDGASADIASFDTQVGTEFQTQVENNVQALADNIQSATSGITGGLFKLIPWQVKLLLLAAAIGAFWFYVMPFIRARKAVAI